MHNCLCFCSMFHINLVNQPGGQSLFKILSSPWYLDLEKQQQYHPCSIGSSSCVLHRKYHDWGKTFISCLPAEMCVYSCYQIQGTFKYVETNVNHVTTSVLSASNIVAWEFAHQVFGIPCEFIWKWLRKPHDGGILAGGLVLASCLTIHSPLLFYRFAKCFYAFWFSHSLQCQHIHQASDSVAIMTNVLTSCYAPLFLTLMG